MLKTLIIIGIVIGSLSLLWFIACFLVWVAIFYHRGNPKIKDNIYDTDLNFNNTYDRVMPLIEDMLNDPHRDVWIKAKDKVKLHGVIYEWGNKNSPLAICFHGYRGNKFRDFAGGYQILKSLGYNILLIDERAHGESGGCTITFGAKESYDVLEWVKFAIKEYGENVRITLQGISMGAATVLIAATCHNLPENVVSISVDCPFSDPVDQFLFSMRKSKVPKWLTIALTVCSLFLFGHVRIQKYSAKKNAGKLHLPTLLIHGENDSIVNVEFSKDIATRSPLIQLELFPGAEHGYSYFEDNDRYLRIAYDFAKKNEK